MDEQDTLLVEAAYAAYRGALVRSLTAMTRLPDVAEDVAQEAYLRLVREVEAGRVPNDIPAWLHRVGANLVATRGRRRSVSDRKAPYLRPPAPSADPEEEVVHAELSDVLNAALASLPDDARAALVLAAHGYGGPEIAQRISRSSGATRTLLCRARSRLRVQMTALGYAAP
jgi:RNA polymerase sigma-70 factor (ECF subfamily)